MAQKIAILLIMVFLSGCATPRNMDNQGEFFDDSLSTGISMVCLYLNNTLACNIDNRNHDNLSAWIEQKIETPTARASRETLAYQGNKKLIKFAYKLKPIDQGTESITVRIKGKHGTILKREIL